jgi:quercetin dioxygenase-like cupin family protein
MSRIVIKPFSTFKLETGCLATNCDAQFPTAVHAWRNDELNFAEGGTHFGFVQSGDAVLRTKAGEFSLRDKMYFCVPDEFSIAGGCGLVVTRLNFRGMFTVGGALEATGRLRYIDGCTDTLLVAPPLLGDPCLNALYFPENIRQTPHTHPSVRVGLIVAGAGECLTAEGAFPLRAGQAFVIAPETLHSFNTGERAMTVVAYHPDSDFGATHDDHPMINRTMIDGVSAANLTTIRTGKK